MVGVVSKVFLKHSKRCVLENIMIYGWVWVSNWSSPRLRGKTINFRSVKNHLKTYLLIPSPEPCTQGAPLFSCPSTTTKRENRVIARDLDGEREKEERRRRNMKKGRREEILAFPTYLMCLTWFLQLKSKFSKPWVPCKIVFRCKKVKKMDIRKIRVLRKA